MNKKEAEFLEQYVTMMANHEAELEGRIRDARQAQRAKIQQDYEENERLQVQAEQEELARRQRIAEYYGVCLNRNNVNITAEEIISDQFNDFGGNYWQQIFRSYGEFAPQNPFYGMDLEQRLFFIGIADLKAEIFDHQFRPIISPLLDGLQLTDIMAHFKPIEETSGTFADEIPNIHKKLELYKASLGNVE